LIFDAEILMLQKYSILRSHLRNVGDKQGYKQNPYKLGTQVEEFITKEEMVFVRVHGAKNQQGSWLMRKDQIEGLTAEEIRARFSIPGKISNVSEVRVPPNTRIRTGIANSISIFKGKDFNETQYELLGRLPKDNFKEIEWKFPRIPRR
jgi:hypothetical protein